MRLTVCNNATRLLGMNELLTAEQMEARARDAGLSLHEVCKRADIAVSTFWRWKRGLTKPSIGVYQRLIAATEPAKAA